MLTMVKNELSTLTNEETGEPFTEDEIDGGGLRVTTTFTKKAMDAAEEGVAEVRPEGKEFSDKNLHIGVASVEVDTGAVRGIFAGQDFLRVPDQLGGRRRPGRLVGQAVRAGRRAQGGLLAQGHLRRQLALRARGRHRRSATRATTTTARRST